MADPLRESDPPRIGPYRLQGRLGGGGMGRVYLGRSPGGRQVAVKVVRPELAGDAEFRRRFAAEVTAARKVGGFYTAQVVDSDTDADPPWMATAYIPGLSLDRVVTTYGPLPLVSVSVLGAGLAEGLATVHAQGLVHRDLKPGNVILAEDGPRLIDFGIARALDTTSHTQTSTVLGTAAFMSPEQARAQKVGPASDVFSLGCVLAFAATGHSPFGEGPAHAVAYRIVHEDADLTGLPTPLADLVASCLAKEPNARPGVGRALEELAVSAGPEAEHDGAQWLPEGLTQVIADRRTLSLTAIVPAAATPAATTDPGHPGDPRRPAPRPSGATGTAGTTGAAEAAGRPQTLLVHERRRARDDDPPRPADRERTAVHWMLALFTLVAAVTVVHQLFVASYAGTPLVSAAYDEAWGVWGWRTFAMSLWIAQMVLGVGLVASWLLWFLRVRTLAESFAPGRLRYRPRTAVLGWFVPVGNLFLPKQIADDIWHASSPTDRGGRMSPARVVHLWWSLWLVTLATWPLVWVPWWQAVTDDFEPGPGAGQSYTFELLPMAWAGLAAHVPVVPAAVVTALFVRRLTDMQAARLGTRQSRR